MFNSSWRCILFANARTFDAPGMWFETSKYQVFTLFLNFRIFFSVNFRQEICFVKSRFFRFSRPHKVGLPQSNVSVAKATFFDPMPRFCNVCHVFKKCHSFVWFTFLTNKGSSQLAKKIFEKKQRESIDNGVNSKCVKFRGLLVRKSGAKKYFKFYKSLTKAKNNLSSRDSNPWP